MTRERAKELLPVIQAFADGQEVEFRLLNSDRWGTVYNLPCADDCAYRIKPAPREWWVVFSPLTGITHSFHGTEARAQDSCLRGTGRTVIHVKEVV